MVPELTNETLDLLYNGQDPTSMNRAATELGNSGFPMVAALLQQRANDLLTGNPTLPIPLPALPGLPGGLPGVPGIPGVPGFPPQIPTPSGQQGGPNVAQILAQAQNAGIQIPTNLPGGLNFPGLPNLNIPNVPTVTPGFPSLIRAQVTTVRDPLNLRASPDTFSPILKLIPRGDVVTVLDQSNPTFYKVDSQGVQGWASKQYLTIVA